MEVFMILRQVVDIIYQYKALDYGICAFGILLLIYKSFKINIFQFIKNEIDILDVLIVSLGMLYFVSFLRNTQGMEVFLKTGSVFLLYFLGRVYGEEVFKYGFKVAIVSYIIVYANFIARVIEYAHYYATGRCFSFEEFGIRNSGGLFHYKTDLVVAMIVAMIFIYKYGKSKLLKYITIFLIINLISFSCDARMGQLIVLLEDSLILYDIYRCKNLNLSNKVQMNVKNKHMFTNIIFTLIYISAFLTFIVIQISPIHIDTFNNYFSEEFYWKTEKIFHSRHVIIWDNLNYYSNQSLLTRLLGIDLCSDSIHNAIGDRAHCYYLKLILSIGYIGVLTTIEYFRRIIIKISKNSNRDYRYVCYAFLIMFLLMGISMESIEYTQMSWFPFLFMGAIVTSSNIQNKKISSKK